MGMRRLRLRFFVMTVCASAVLAMCTSTAHATIDEVNWNIMSQTSVTFNWHTDVSSEDDVYYGTSSGTYDGPGSPAAGSEPTPVPDTTGYFYQRTLTGLSEDTLYYYKIGSGGEEHTFRTPIPRGSSGYSIVIASDFQENSSLFPTHTRPVFEQIKWLAPRFVLHCGDTTGADDYGGAPRAHSVFNEMMTWSQDAAYHPCYGNHDTDNATIMGYLKGRIAMPNGYASGSPPVGGGDDWGWFDYGNVRFISYPDWWTGQYSTWNTQVGPVFADAQGDPDIDFIVVWGHRPAWSTGYHDNDGTSGVAPYLNAFGDTYSKFKLALFGHNHIMEMSNPDLTHGVVHAGANSPWPNANYNISAQPWTEFRALHPGFMKLNISDGGMVLQYIASADHDTSHYDVSQVTLSHEEGDVMYSYMIVSLSDLHNLLPTD